MWHSRPLAQFYQPMCRGGTGKAASPDPLLLSHVSEPLCLPLLPQPSPENSQGSESLHPLPSRSTIKVPTQGVTEAPGVSSRHLSGKQDKAEVALLAASPSHRTLTCFVTVLCSKVSCTSPHRLRTGTCFHPKCQVGDNICTDVSFCDPPVRSYHQNTHCCPNPCVIITRLLRICLPQSCEPLEGGDCMCTPMPGRGCEI